MYIMENGLPTIYCVMTMNCKKEAHHGGKIMREPALYVSGRTGKGILFV